MCRVVGSVVPESIFGRDECVWRRDGNTKCQTFVLRRIYMVLKPIKLEPLRHRYFDSDTMARYASGLVLAGALLQGGLVGAQSKSNYLDDV